MGKLSVARGNPGRGFFSTEAEQVHRLPALKRSAGSGNSFGALLHHRAGNRRTRSFCQESYLPRPADCSQSDACRRELHSYGAVAVDGHCDVDGLLWPENKDQHSLHIRHPHNPLSANSTEGAGTEALSLIGVRSPASPVVAIVTVDRAQQRHVTIVPVIVNGAFSEGPRSVSANALQGEREDPVRARVRRGLPGDGLA